jgi:NAD(P)-dependent dehydrogenase (short-subunit alcohol dehydrogenase family)
LLRGRDLAWLHTTVPLKVGWLQPDDISPAAVFLASDAANMVMGAEYEVTGGDSAKDI